MVLELRVALIPEMKIRAGICIMQVPALYYCYKFILLQTNIGTKCHSETTLL